MSEHFCLRIGHDRYNKVVFDADYTNAIFSVRQIAPKYDMLFFFSCIRSMSGGGGGRGSTVEFPLNRCICIFAKHFLQN